jgi:hypothetical protein
MNRVIEFSKYLNYQGIYVDTFSNNMALMRILDKVGGFNPAIISPEVSHIIAKLSPPLISSLNSSSDGNSSTANP